MSALREIPLGDEMAQEIAEIFFVGGWHRLLPIRELVNRLLTLEVLTSFEFDRSYSSFTSNNTIWFCAFGRYHSMSMTQFSVCLGLYTDDYIDNEEYAQLLTDYHHSLTPHRVDKMLYSEGQYESGISKSTCLSWPTYRYIHTIFNRLVNSHGDSIRVRSRQELLYIYSMVQSKPLQLGHIVARYLHH